MACNAGPKTVMIGLGVPNERRDRFVAGWEAVLG